MLLKLLRGFIIPVWLPYVAAVALAFGAVWYIHSAGRAYENLLVTSKYEAEKAEAKKTAEKHFAESARTNAAAIASLRKDHAAELANRDALDDQLTQTLRAEAEKAKAGKGGQCWPLSVVKELRK